MELIMLSAKLLDWPAGSFADAPPADMYRSAENTGRIRTEFPQESFETASPQLHQNIPRIRGREPVPAVRLKPDPVLRAPAPLFL